MPIDTELYPWLSAAAIAWGLLDGFFGYKIFRITIAVLGAGAGAVAGHLAAVGAGFSPGWQIACLVLGALLGAGLAHLLFLGAVFVAGFGFGATLGMMLLAHTHQMVAVLTGCVLGIIGGIAAVKLQKTVLILATSLLGAFRAAVGVMYFTHHLDWVFYYRQPQQIPALISGHPWLLPAVLLLAAVGAVAQFGLGGGSGAGRKPAGKKGPPAAKD